MTNRSVDLIADNIDIALHVGSYDNSALVASKIVDLTQVVCASPKYLARHGRPVHPSDLARHACLTLSHFPGANRWPFQIDGQLVQVGVKGPVAADSAHMLLNWRSEEWGSSALATTSWHARSRKESSEVILQDFPEPNRFPPYGRCYRRADNEPRRSGSSSIS